MDELAHADELGDGEGELNDLRVAEHRSESGDRITTATARIGVHYVGVADGSAFPLGALRTVDVSRKRELGKRFIEQGATGPVAESAVQSIVAGVQAGNA